MDGIIVINKGEGYTSHDVVACLRRILDCKRVGHTGTLDPGAVGVLPICVGRATKAAELFAAAQKQYIAEVILGAETDTQDSSGRVVRTAAVQVTEGDIRRAAQGFLGDLEQIPPMYSAVKQEGKKLYELAREGIAVERQPRPVHIYGIEILELRLPQAFTMRVDCSKGTYIRTLCQDMGESLGCLAHMGRLCRTKSGRFSIEEALTLEQVEAMAQAGDGSFLLPIDQALTEYPPLYVSERKGQRIRNGARISTPGMTEGEVYRVYDETGAFLAVSKVEDGVLKIWKSFY